MSAPSFVVFSGGSACNHITKTFQSISSSVSYIISISDNGGSSSELQRLLGGPAIGDLRSRLTRLIDTVDPNPSEERIAIRDLLSHRLSSDPIKVQDEWAAIVEGRHCLWKKIPAEKKETIRGFLTHFNGEILKRAHKRFNYCNGSIGNFFLTGARLFFGSLEAALFLFSAITGIDEATSVIPVINTNHTATIAAELQDGQVIIGQCEISHPSPASATNVHHLQHCNPIDAFMRIGLDDDNTRHLLSGSYDGGDNDNDDDDLDPQKKAPGNLFFSKHANEQLPSPIHRIYYINEYGQEIFPVPNPKCVTQLSTRTTLVYSMGSLFTSLVPNLILRHVGKAVVESRTLKHKILLLNGSHDRETDGFTAMDFIMTITAALNESQRIDCRRAFYETTIRSSSSSSLSSSNALLHSSSTSAIACPPSNLSSPPRSGTNSGVNSLSTSPHHMHGFKHHFLRMTSSSSASMNGAGSGYHAAARHQVSPPSTGAMASSYVSGGSGSYSIDSGYASISSSPMAHYPPFPDQLFSASPPSSFITHLVYLDQGAVHVDVPAIEDLGIQCIKVKADCSSGAPLFTDASLTEVLASLTT